MSLRLRERSAGVKKIKPPKKRKPADEKLSRKWSER